MNKQKQISIFVDEKDLELIDQGAKRNYQSRSSFMILSALEKGKMLNEKARNLKVLNEEKY